MENKQEIKRNSYNMFKTTKKLLDKVSSPRPTLTSINEPRNTKSPYVCGTLGLKKSFLPTLPLSPQYQSKRDMFGMSSYVTMTTNESAGTNRNATVKIKVNKTINY
jgi:hypothetical protein